MKVLLSLTLTFALSLCVEAETKDEFELMLKKEYEKQQEYRLKVLPKIEAYFHKKYVEANEKKYAQLKRKLLSLKKEKKASSKKADAARIKEEESLILKQIELLEVLINYDKAFRQFNSPKNAKAYSKSYKEMIALRKKYKEFTGRDFPNFIQDYHQRHSKKK